MYDIIIVGGGISGLFLAYKLSQTNQDILLVEQSNRLGGRIHTIHENNLAFDAGGARFSSKHKKMLALLHELDLDQFMYLLPDTIQFIDHTQKISYSLHKELKRVVTYSKKLSKIKLQSISFYQLCIQCLGYQKATQLKNMFGYDSEFIIMNAYSAVTMFKTDLLSKTDYYCLEGGLENIIHSLKAILSTTSNVEIKLNAPVSDIQNKSIQVHSKIYKAKKIIVAIPVKEISQFPLFQQPLFQSVTPIPLLRIYAQYPVPKSGKVWFHTIQRTITDNYIRHIIPINYEKGLIMISYTDGNYAQMWNRLSQKDLIQELHKQVKVVCNIQHIPNPIFIKTYYWNEGVHMWNVGSDMKDTYQKIIKPYDKKDIYICNEAFSKHQCWIEGCLDMAYDVLEKMDTFTRNIVLQGGVSKQPKKKIKYYPLQEVLKKRSWIILKLGNKYKIFNVAKWMNKHPGGSSKLKEGIKANKYYLSKGKNPRYPQSPIQLFKSIGAHSSGKVIKNMLSKNNEYIQLVGYVKMK
jgi:monoamine oxidase